MLRKWLSLDDDQNEPASELTFGWKEGGIPLSFFLELLLDTLVDRYRGCHD
jgi:hypothetical protein